MKTTQSSSNSKSFARQIFTAWPILLLSVVLFAFIAFTITSLGIGEPASIGIALAIAVAFAVLSYIVLRNYDYSLPSLIESFDPDRNETITFVRQVKQEGSVQREIVEAVDKLPPLEKKVITLLFFSDLGFNEIANRLGTTISEVRVLRHNALRRLAEDQKLHQTLNKRKE